MTAKQSTWLPSLVGKCEPRGPCAGKKMRSFPESCFICLRLKGVLDAHKMDRDYNVLLLSVKTLQRVTSGEIKHIRNRKYHSCDLWKHVTPQYD